MQRFLYWTSIHVDFLGKYLIVLSEQPEEEAENIADIMGMLVRPK